MPSFLERHVTANAPGYGWYWEIIADSSEVIARGLPRTPPDKANLDAAQNSS